MKFLRLKVDGFGGLTGEFVLDPGRAVLVVDDNERGKSTLLAALHAGLYGLPADKRSHRPLTPIDRWRPWDGGPYRLELEVEHEGERYCIRRDFERGTVGVWNGRGQEVTPEFREGRDEFPIGQKLTGLDSDEFQKCALVGQGELSEVVPADEKARRSGTLRARLENAADTRVGDTNASEALRVLEGALRKYNCPEVDSTGTVDTAIQRLETKRGLLETELKALEHDLAQIHEPLEELAALGEEERQARDALANLESERRASIAAEVRRRLDENRVQKEQVEKLRAEAEGLAAAEHLPANSEGQLRETIARYQEAQHSLEGLEQRRRGELERERGRVDSELETLSTVANCTAEEADRCVAVAAELRGLVTEDSRLRDQIFSLRESLATRGLEPERINWLTQRFGNLDSAQQGLLRGQSEVALAYQTEVAQLESTRTSSTEVLREIDAVRTRWRLPAWLLLGLGIAGMATGGGLFATHAAMTFWSAFLGVGGLVAAVGLSLILAGSRAREAERESALRSLTDAQGRLNLLKSRRAETEVGLGEMSRRMGYRDQVELLREWNEYARLMEESAPALRAQEQIAGIEARRADATERARTLLERVGGGTPDPARLDRIAADIRRALVLHQRKGEMERNWSWIDEEKRVAEAAALGLKERALRILQSAGLTYDPDRSWEDHAHELGERVRGKSRYLVLIEELIPQAEARLLGEQPRRDLEAQLAAIDGELASAGSGRTPDRTPLQVETENRTHREALEKAQRRRSDLRVQVEDVQRRYAAEHPAKTTEKARIEQALDRARRFRHAVELARETIQQVASDTHRRWAEFLNTRVAEILGPFGGRIEQLRFGDDLDFSVKLWNGQQVPRARADLQLSAGARDQLYLSVRLAISEFLSRGQSPLPILLDDPFATSDDERARTGMRLLLERFARDHQIVVLTCHRGRYEAMAAQDRELYDGHVQWLDIRAASAARR